MTDRSSEPRDVLYKRHRFPAEIISHAMWLYFRFPLSLRHVEDLLAERGIEVSFQTVAEWAVKLGAEYARRIRRLSKGGFADKWHLDRDRVVIGVRDAAKVLLHDWPDKDSRKRVIAMQACLDVINGKKRPSVARAAFIAAAKDARIYLGEAVQTPPK
jgi:hypothetical protein